MPVLTYFRSHNLDKTQVNVSRKGGFGSAKTFRARKVPLTLPKISIQDDEPAEKKREEKR